MELQENFSNIVEKNWHSQNYSIRQSTATLNKHRLCYTRNANEAMNHSLYKKCERSNESFSVLMFGNILAGVADLLSTAEADYAIYWTYLLDVYWT